MRNNRARSQSYGSDFPPPMRRTSTDATGAPRPVPFAAKFQRIHPGTTGVTVLEHLERLDAVEASLQRLESDETAPSAEEEEMDMGVSSAPVLGRNPTMPLPIGRSNSGESSSSQHVRQASYGGPQSPPLAAVPEVSTPSRRSSMSMDEEDLVALSKSTSHIPGERGNPFEDRRGIGTIATAGIDWVSAEAEDHDEKKVFIAEVSVRTK